jgi:hypothetical protein
MRTQLLVGAIVLGVLLGGCAAQSATAPQQQESSAATSTASVAPTTSPEATELSVSSIEIKAGQTPEALGRNLFEVAFPNWYIAGADEKLSDKVTDYIVKNGDSQLESFYRDLAQENTAVFSEALFSDTLRPEVAADFEQINMWVMDMRFRTSDNEEPYRLWNTVESSELSSESGSTRTVLVTFTTRDNSKSGVNSAGKFIAAGTELDGDKSEALITFDGASGIEKITSFTVVPAK